MCCVVYLLHFVPFYHILKQIMSGRAHKEDTLFLVHSRVRYVHKFSLDTVDWQLCSQNKQQRNTAGFGAMILELLDFSMTCPSFPGMNGATLSRYPGSLHFCPGSYCFLPHTSNKAGPRGPPECILLIRNQWPAFPTSMAQHYGVNIPKSPYHHLWNNSFQPLVILSVLWWGEGGENVWLHSTNLCQVLSVPGTILHTAIPREPHIHKSASAAPTFLWARQK